MGFFRHRCSKCGAWCTWINNGLEYGWWCPACDERRQLKERVAELENKLR